MTPIRYIIKAVKRERADKYVRYAYPVKSKKKMILYRNSKAEEGVSHIIYF